MQESLESYLQSIERAVGWRVVRVLKSSETERTELVERCGPTASADVLPGMADAGLLQDADALTNAAAGAQLPHGADLLRSATGPEVFVRKVLMSSAGFGDVYERLFEAQQRGKKFKHLPRIVECSSNNEARTVVMEFVNGVTLDQAPRAELFEELCEAVAELHERFDPPIIHRDLKPANIMVEADGRIRLIDFGISRTFTEGAGADTTHFGTRAWAPPEQFGFAQTDVRSDVYALGLLLYFMLTGEEPSGEAREANFAHPQIPEATRAVILQACALDPAARFTSVNALVAAHAQAMKITPTRVEEASRTNAAAKPSAAASPKHASKPWSASELLGAAWTALLVALLAIMQRCSFELIFFPEANGTSDLLFYQRLITYEGLVLMLLLPLAYLLSDRRLWRRIFGARYRRPSWTRELMAACVSIALYFFALIIFCM